MNACDAAGPGRKIEVEGKKYAPPAPVFDRYPIVSTEDVPIQGVCDGPNGGRLGKSVLQERASHDGAIV
jgi:hypothetical protein